jgi:outer membrane protein OmpU
MRKLLLGTTALAAAATLTANAALADVSISGAYEWAYNSRSSNQTTLDGTTFSSDSEIKFTFTNKTDSGLTITAVSELEADGDGTSTMDEHSLSISGGFGTIKLGNDDSVGDNFGIEAEDLIAEEQAPNGANATVSTDTDITPASGDNNKISYYLPAMGGFKAGISHTTTVDGASDSTEYGAQFTTSAAGSTITIGGATGTTDNATKDIDSQNIGVKIVSGPVSVILAQGSYEADDEDREANGASISYNMGNGMTIGAYTMESDDALDAGEEYSKSGAEVQYTIASGLTAVLTVEDYEYKVGTGGSGTADSGTNSRLTIKASF